MTQCPFPKVSELQLRADGVNATSRHRDAVDVAVRESTRLVNVQRQFRECRSAQVQGVDKMLAVLENALEQYNESNAVMDLVLFEDAMKHIALTQC